MIGRAIFNRTPLPPNRLSPLPLGAIEPAGWLGDRLKAQAAALESSLGEFFPGCDGGSQWLGGTMDDGERAPEALSSLLPIAYASTNPALKAVVARFVDWALKSQRPSGDFGPEGMRDWWGKILMLRVMRMQFTATADREILKLMDRFFRFQLEALAENPLRGKACARAAENMQSVLLLYNLTGQKHLIKLCEVLRAQGLDWTDELHIFPHIRATDKHRPWPALEEAMAREGELDGLDQKVNGREYHLTNAVDVAFGLKTPGVVNLFKSGFKEVSAFKVGWPKYMKQHGVALSMFTGDDHLAGADPARGVNLAAISETINTLSTLMGMGDDFDAQAADAMEKLALNALGSAWTNGMTTRQALLQVNQLGADSAPRGFYNAPDDAICYEKRPLDLADQGFAAYALNQWYATSDDGLYAAGYAPCTVQFVASGERVRVRVMGGYPHSGTVRVLVETRACAEFPVYLRIPGWAGQVMLKLPDGELMQMRGGETACVRRKWSGEAVIEIEIPMEPRITRWFHRSGAVELGPLLMCLACGEGAWNWALLGDAAMKPVLQADTARVLVKAISVPDWERDGADCAAPPIAPEPEGEAQVLELTPFYASRARIAQFPVV